MKVKQFEINKEIFIKKIIDPPHKNVIDEFKKEILDLINGK